MYRLLPIHSASQLASLTHTVSGQESIVLSGTMSCAAPLKTMDSCPDRLYLDGLTPITPETFSHDAPDAHWVLIQNQQTLVAHCSLWWQHTPRHPGQQLGYIGHYGASDSQASAQILNHACQELCARKCTIAVAPIDGNTWRRYRLLSERGTEPIFFLEPNNPDQWCGYFKDANFVPFATYRSALNLDLTQHDPRLERVEQRLTKAGVTIRSLNLQQFEQELQQIYQVSRISFRNNFLYTPVNLDEFIAQYIQIQPYINPEFVLMAEHNNHLVGFIFALPDWLQMQQRSPINTVIIKTVAIFPGRQYAGLGSVLVERVQAIAHRLGYVRAIHALMHDANPSRNLSSRYAETIRRYTLFARSLRSD